MNAVTVFRYTLNACIASFCLFSHIVEIGVEEGHYGVISCLFLQLSASLPACPAPQLANYCNNEVVSNSEAYSEIAIYTMDNRSRYPSEMQILIINDAKQVASMRIRSTRNHSRNIAIISIVDEKFDEREVVAALSSLRCYALVHGYPFEFVRETSEWRQRCPQTDIMFRRHCITSYILPKYEWILFVDADVGVVNPTRLIEEFVDDKYDLIFYDRFYNWEISCGSYLARNSTEAIDFLRKFAEYEKNLPNSFHGRDNGAIHFYVVERLITAISINARLCRGMWNHSNNYDDLFAAEACIRILLAENEHFNPRMKILPKGNAWVRDGFLTRGMWSWKRDFMLHGLKNRSLVSDSNVKLVIADGDLSRLYHPFTRLNFNDTECAAGSQIWHWDAQLMVDETTLTAALQMQLTKADNWFHNVVKRMQILFINASNYT